MEKLEIESENKVLKLQNEKITKTIQEDIYLLENAEYILES